MLNSNDVYLHRRADTGSVFYVGIGRKGRALSRGGRTNHWKNIVTKHGLSVQYIERGLTREQAIEVEVFLISWLGRVHNGTGPLINITDGGEGCPGRDKGKRLSQEHRAKMAAAKLGTRQSPETVAKRVAKNIGKKRSDAQRAVMSLAAQDRSPEHLEKIAAALRGRPVPQHQLDAIRAASGRAIVNADSGMKFDTLAEAVEWLKATGYQSAAAGNVCACCKGLRKSAYGYRWKYFA